jgi:uncharacterized membrane protein
VYVPATAATGWMEARRMVLAEGLLTRNGIGYLLFPWAHVVFGVAWVGLLYYFNVVQVPAFAAFGDEVKARNVAIDQLARRALWWFRWASVATVVTGLGIALIVEDYFFDGFGQDPGGLAIALGMTIGLLMFVNVWGVIWRAQKVVLANAATVLQGGPPNPDAPIAARRAVMVSRANLILSVPMIFFMVYRSHNPGFVDPVSSGGVGLYWGVSIPLIAVIEVASLGLTPWKAQVNKGLNVLFDGPGVRNPLIAAFGLFAVLAVLTEICFRMNG